MTLVSVCIPTYNRAKYIGATIQSALNSTYSNLEIIVSDNASTDNTAEIVKGFADPRIRFYRNEHNLGPIKNWNLAIQRSSGDLVGLLFSDDLYGPFWLTFAVHVLQKYPHIGWVATAFCVIDDQDQVIEVVKRFPETREYSCVEAFPFIATMDGLGSVYVARRELVENIGFYDEETGLFADHDFFLRLAAASPLYYSTNCRHAIYRAHSGNRLMKEWKDLQRIRESLHILDKTFHYGRLPEELQLYEKPSYIHFYQSALRTIGLHLQQGLLESAQELIHLLSTKGYSAPLSS